MTPQIIPNIFQWTTFPITSLLTTLWSQYEPRLDHISEIDPHIIETVSILERTLNYAHTGSAKVLTRGLMDVSWLSLGVIFDGLPTLSNNFASHPALVSGSLTLLTESWPVYISNGRPLISSRRVQLYNYGEQHYEVSDSIDTSLSNLFFRNFIITQSHCWMICVISIAHTLLWCEQDINNQI